MIFRKESFIFSFELSNLFLSKPKPSSRYNIFQQITSHFNRTTVQRKETVWPQQFVGYLLYSFLVYHFKSHSKNSNGSRRFLSTMYCLYFLYTLYLLLRSKKKRIHIMQTIILSLKVTRYIIKILRLSISILIFTLRKFRIGDVLVVFA